MADGAHGGSHEALHAAGVDTSHSESSSEETTGIKALATGSVEVLTAGVVKVSGDPAESMVKASEGLAGVVENIVSLGNASEGGGAAHHVG